eukprot:681099-Pyramimonas_sp.AAC.1
MASKSACDAFGAHPFVSSLLRPKRARVGACETPRRLVSPQTGLKPCYHGPIEAICPANMRPSRSWGCLVNPTCVPGL